MEESNKITGTQMIGSLSDRNRAYQVLRALDRTEDNFPPTLTDAEAHNIIAIVQDIADGHIATELDKLLAHKLSPAMKIYVADGTIDAEISE